MHEAAGADDVAPQVAKADAEDGAVEQARMTSQEIPARWGCRGRGDADTLGLGAAISSMVISSLRLTKHLAPSSPKCWTNCVKES
jgi:hypothetical protein